MLMENPNRRASITIPVAEYKELLFSSVQLSIIYQKSSKADAYDVAALVQEMRNTFCNVPAQEAPNAE